MTDAHYHLVVNHFPIIGTILGFGILITGIFLKNITVKSVSYFIFLIAAIFAFLSVKTGGMAAGVVKDFPEIGRKIIHEHAEIAEKLALVLYVLALVSIIGLYFNAKNHAKEKLISFLALLIAGIAVFLGQQAGTTGGEIRHTEIRKDFKTADSATDNNHGQHQNAE